MMVLKAMNVKSLKWEFLVAKQGACICKSIS